MLKAAWLETPIGTMMAIADEKNLYLLEFFDSLYLERKIEELKRKTKLEIVSGSAPPLDSIKKELNQYFEGKLKKFKTPFIFLGSPFQQRVWKALQTVSFGQVQTYKYLANQIEQPSAVRAVAQANRANQLAIIIPCHRIIKSDGEWGGYGGGQKRKQWLIHYEKTL